MDSVTSPFLTAVLGRFDAPIVYPGILLAGGILGSAFIVFSIINFDLERLDKHQFVRGIFALTTSIFLGVSCALVVFGLMMAFGFNARLKRLLIEESKNVAALFLGGAVYGMPVGAILGLVIGFATLLTQVWSRKPVLV